MIEMKELLEKEGYTNLRFIAGRGWCGIMRMIYTTGLFHGLTEHSREGRWCYQKKSDAVKALNLWDGKSDPDGDWIKYKGATEYSNQNIEKTKKIK